MVPASDVAQTPLQQFATLISIHHQQIIIMAKHHPDLVMCRKQPGIATGRLCEKCDGKCVICDSFVNPSTIVHICEECNYGSLLGRCVVCGGVGVTDAYYCRECVQRGR